MAACVITLLQLAHNKNFIEQTIAAMAGTTFAQAVSTHFHQAVVFIDGGTYTGSFTLALFWTCVGLLVYVVLMRARWLLGEANSLTNELTYANLNRRALLQDVVLRSMVRFLAVIVWLGFIHIVVADIVPLCTRLFRQGTIPDISLSGFGWWLVACFILFATFHINVVLCRLIALRVRLFSQVIGLE